MTFLQFILILLACCGISVVIAIGILAIGLWWECRTNPKKNWWDDQPEWMKNEPKP